jgi:hypothetical protein
MSKEPGIPLVLPLDDASATLSQVGGKGVCDKREHRAQCVQDS